MNDRAPAENTRRELLLDAPIRPNSSIAKLLGRAIALRASDLHLHSDAPVFVRVDGGLRPLDTGTPLKAERIGGAIREVMGEARWSDLLDRGQIQFVCTSEGGTRFRTTVLQQQRGVDAVFRIIPPSPPAIADLALPPQIESLTTHRTGLVLCTGPVACGKSTTMAALIDVIAARRRDHILLLESPIEFIYAGRLARVSQRQIGRDSESYATALKSALREDPDVIAVAELRDRETIGLAMTAAETGHLVLGTMHTDGAVQTINRIINSFSAAEQSQVRVMLSESLRAVCSQRLLRHAGGVGRVPAVEVLVVTQAVANLIRESKTHQIPSQMQVGRSSGMQTMEMALQQLVLDKLITRETADAAAASAAIGGA